MKTVVRLLVAVGIVFTAVLAFTACDDDDKDDQTSIIGVWSLVESKAAVTPIATATLTQAQLEAAIANYLQIPVDSRVTFTSTSVTFPLSVNTATAQNKTLQYVLNDGTLTILNPASGVAQVQGGASLKDDELKIELSASSYLNLLQTVAQKDAQFKDVVDQLSSASIYYRLKRIK